MRSYYKVNLLIQYDMHHKKQKLNKPQWMHSPGMEWPCSKQGTARTQEQARKDSLLKFSEGAGASKHLLLTFSLQNGDMCF